MAPARAPLLLLLLLLLLAGAVQRCPAQHWSHGWYPGGKRDLAAPPGAQVSELSLPHGAPGRPLRPPPPRGLQMLEPPRRPWRRM